MGNVTNWERQDRCNIIFCKSDMSDFPKQEHTVNVYDYSIEQRASIIDLRRRDNDESSL